MARPKTSWEMSVDESRFIITTNMLLPYLIENAGKAQKKDIIDVIVKTAKLDRKKAWKNWDKGNTALMAWCYRTMNKAMESQGVKFQEEQDLLSGAEEFLRKRKEAKARNEPKAEPSPVEGEGEAEPEAEVEAEPEKPKVGKARACDAEKTDELLVKLRKASDMGEPLSKQRQALVLSFMSKDEREIVEAALSNMSVTQIAYARGDNPKRVQRTLDRFRRAMGWK